ncbi:hypothetical protein FJZ17_00340 [Candidatus Pacearchaeota archaeon]|nr:hypothetical protein [Candidatus Pacearchaeota archaeon]
MPGDIKEFKLGKIRKEMFTRQYHLFELIEGKPVRMGFPNATRTCNLRFLPKVGELELIRIDNDGDHKHYACKIKLVRFNGVYIDPQGFEIPCNCYDEAMRELKQQREKDRGNPD